MVLTESFTEELQPGDEMLIDGEVTEVRFILISGDNVIVTGFDEFGDEAVIVLPYGAEVDLVAVRA